MYTNDDLRIMQAWPLERKVQVTQTRIIEWYQHFDGNIYVSFSGGKDSTVLLDLTRRIYPEIPAVYIDTGLEYPEIKQFVKSQTDVTILRPKLRFDEVIDKYGYPVVSKEQASYIEEYRNTKSDKLRNIRLNGNAWGMGKISNKWLYLIDAPFKISDRCCDIMKKLPAKTYEKSTGRHPLIATMAEESKQRESNWKRYGCNAFDKTRPTSQPMSFWTEQDVLQYLKATGTQYSTVYGQIRERERELYTTGCSRTGCIFCMFGIHLDAYPNRFQSLKLTHPVQYEYCMKDIDEGGLGISKVLDYLKIEH